MKKNKKIIIIILAFIVTSILTIGGIILYPNINNKLNETNKILIYLNSDKELKYLVNNDKESILLTKSFDEDIKVKYNNERNKFIYLKDMGLYLVDINKKTNDKIGVEVIDYGFIIDKYVYYIDSSNNLYLYKDDEKIKLDVNVKTVIKIKKNYIIYNKDNNMYLYNIKNDNKEIVMKNYVENKNIFIDDNVENIIYLEKEEENYNLYKYNIANKKSNLLINNVYEIIDANNDLSSIMYKVLTGNEKYYDLFINDDSNIASDTPSYTCHFYNDEYYPNSYISDPSQKLYFLYYNSYTKAYDYYLEDDEAEYGILYKKATQDILNGCNTNTEMEQLVTYIKNYETTINFYNVYLYEEGKTTLLAEKINDIYYKDAKKGQIIYNKYNTSEENKIKISSITSIDNFEQIINNLEYYLYYSSKANPNVSINKLKNKTLNTNIVDNNIFYTINSEKVELYNFNIGNNENKLLENSINNNSIIYDTNNYDIIYLANYDNEKETGDLYGYNNNKSISIDNNVNSNIWIRNDYLYYFKDYNKDNLSGTFLSRTLKNNKQESIDDVSYVIPISDEYKYVLKDYSKSTNSFSLYRYNSKYETIGYNIINYNYSG